MVNQMWTGLAGGWGSQKFSNLCGHPSWMTPNSIMCGYLCIGRIDFMLKGKNLLDYTNLFSRNVYEKNDKIILKYCQ